MITIPQITPPGFAAYLFFPFKKTFLIDMAIYIPSPSELARTLFSQTCTYGLFSIGGANFFDQEMEVHVT
jgi:hypothetical protein